VCSESIATGLKLPPGEAHAAVANLRVDVMRLKTGLTCSIHVGFGAAMLQISLAAGSLLGAIAAQHCKQVNNWLLIKLLRQGLSSNLAFCALALLLSLPS